MYIAPGLCLFIGICLGVLLTFASMVGVALYANYREEKKLEKYRLSEQSNSDKH